MSYHWYGTMIYPDEATRDAGYDKVHDYVDGVIGVLEHPHATIPPGLTKVSHINGAEVNGPGFTISIRIPDEEYLTTDEPPQQGRASVLQQELNDTEGTEASVGFVPIVE